MWRFHGCRDVHTARRRSRSQVFHGGNVLARFTTMPKRKVNPKRVLPVETLRQDTRDMFLGVSVMLWVKRRGG